MLKQLIKRVLKFGFLVMIMHTAEYGVSEARILLVPSQYSTIASAMASVAVFDTILLAPNIYRERIEIDRGITIGSNYLTTGDTAFISCTILTIPDSIRLDSTNSRSVIRAHRAVGFSVVGVTVREGMGTVFDPLIWSSSIWGGGLFADSSTVLLDHCHFTNCQASNGGGIGLFHSNATIRNCQVDSCVGYGYGRGGGGMRFYGDSISVLSSTFSVNHHYHGFHGGVAIDAFRSGIIDRSVFIRNKAPRLGGAGLLAGCQTVINCQVIDNQSSAYAGFYIDTRRPRNARFDATIQNSHFSGNHSDSTFGYYTVGDGGCIGFAGTDSSFWRLTNNVFENNIAGNANVPRDGGAIVMQSGNLYFSKNVVANNIARKGAAILTRNDAVSIIDSNTFRSNHGTNINLFWSGGSATLTYNDFIDNEGAAISLQDEITVVTAINNFWGDSTGPNVVPGNPNGQGDSLGQGILYIPWLTEPVFPENDVSPEHGSLPTRLPQEFGLMEAYPNPFNASTTISFSLPKYDPAIRIDIFDPSGRAVTNLYHGSLTSGKHSLRWQPVGIASGVYFVQAQGNRTAQFATTIHYLK